MRMLQVAVGTLVVALAATGCGAGDDPLNEDGGDAAGNVVKIGSADFPENELLAEIYAGALQAKDVETDTSQLRIGAREAYIRGLKDGSIDLIPEYTGNLLQYFDDSTTVVEEDEVYTKLQQALPGSLTVLDKAAAEDKDAVTVTKQTANKYDLRSIGDLQPHASDLVLGGPSEWAERPTGVPGLKKEYGLEFKRFRPLKDTQPVQWLKNGQIDVANIFTTDPATKENGFVQLDDPKNLFVAQNVVPLLNKKKVTPKVKSALNGVSAKLDTETLLTLMTQVVTEKKDPSVVAKDWLQNNGLA